MVIFQRVEDSTPFLGHEGSSHTLFSTSVLDPDPHWSAKHWPPGSGSAWKNVNLDLAVCKFIPRAKSQGFFLKGKHDKNRHWVKDMAQLAKYVGNRQYKAKFWLSAICIFLKILIFLWSGSGFTLIFLPGGSSSGSVKNQCGSETLFSTKQSMTRVSYRLLKAVAFFLDKGFQSVLFVAVHHPDF